MIQTYYIIVMIVRQWISKSVQNKVEMILLVNSIIGGKVTETACVIVVHFFPDGITPPDFITERKQDLLTGQKIRVLDIKNAGVVFMETKPLLHLLAEVIYTGWSLFSSLPSSFSRNRFQRSADWIYALRSA